MFNLFTIVILAVIGSVAFFHYTQGFFSAAISVVLCILAAVLAVSYHEVVVDSLLGGRMADSAHAMVVLALFGLIYLVARTIIDKAVPGNVTLPAAVDKAGAAVMGLVAGAFAAGVVAFAAQSMPLGNSLLGYSRYAADDKQVMVPVRPRNLDRDLHKVMDATSFDPREGAAPQSLVVPVDDLLIGTVKRLNAGGSLSGSNSLAHAHPDWLTELYGQRVGMEPAAKRVALQGQAKVEGLYTLPQVQQKDFEFSSFQRGWKGPGGKLPTTFPSSTPGEGAAKAGAKSGGGSAQALVIVRVTFTQQAADKDRVIRLSPGSVRLITKRREAGGEPEWFNYFPIGTYDGPTKTLFRNRPDDYLFINEGAEPTDKEKGVDFAFWVDKEGFLEEGMKADLTRGNHKITPDSYLEVKRLARIDLSDKELATKPLPALPQIKVIYKPDILNPPNDSGLQGGGPGTPNPAPTQPTPAPAPAPAPEAPPPPLEVTGAKVYDRFYIPLNVSAPSGSATDAPLGAGGTVSLQNKKLTAIRIPPQDPTKIRGQFPELSVPDGKVMVQVEARVPSGPNVRPWEWAGRVSELALKDDKGAVHKAVGAWANFDQGGTTLLVAAFQADGPLVLPQFSDPGVPAKQVWVAFYVPKGVRVKEALMGNTTLKGVPVDLAAE